MISGVYKIQHRESGRLYIGSSKDVYTRLRKHKESLRRNDHVNAALQNGFRVHGEDAFVFKLILVCAEKDNITYEQAIIDFYKANIKPHGYNIRKKAESNAGYESKRLLHRKGDKYGRLTLIEVREKLPTGNKWLCQCDCGNTTVASVSSVKYGQIQSCGCLMREVNRTRRDRKAGEKFNRLTLVECRGIGTKENHKLWLCRCDCGNHKVVPVHRVVNGKTKSCGCLVGEAIRRSAAKRKLVRSLVT